MNTVTLPYSVLWDMATGCRSSDYGPLSHSVSDHVGHQGVKRVSQRPLWITVHNTIIRSCYGPVMDLF